MSTRPGALQPNGKTPRNRAENYGHLAWHPRTTNTAQTADLPLGGERSPISPFAYLAEAHDPATDKAGEFDLKCIRSRWLAYDNRASQARRGPETCFGETAGIRVSPGRRLAPRQRQARRRTETRRMLWTIAGRQWRRRSRTRNRLWDRARSGQRGVRLLVAKT